MKKKSRLKRLAGELASRQGEVTAEELEHIAYTLIRAMQFGDIKRTYIVDQSNGSIFFEFSEEDDAFVEVQTGIFGISEHGDETRKLVSQFWPWSCIQTKFEYKPRSEIVNYFCDRCE